MFLKCLFKETGVSEIKKEKNNPYLHVGYQGNSYIQICILFTEVVVVVCVYVCLSIRILKTAVPISSQFRGDGIGYVLGYLVI